MLLFTGGRGPCGGPISPSTSEDGWQVVTKTSCNILKPSRMKLTKVGGNTFAQCSPGGDGHLDV